ncbi:mannose-6-phosphate isomerase-like protein [Candidatus Koribacter versatilis Ellin345]|uniref:Mannose-6-phosphate isomerase-like protein n=1 Tax=Koribacter versatilis (strain Ellin345) TaxID=204669 RepID=Q1IU06_KORVE|nr:class I mannose-6-phosphate isomerase [Candidatus Koribacter versatilis]ABF39644.1 mannose-6-phosphate isomerase-like protein [Candidatus Koribacter versatilis Ellin345]
MSKQSSSNYDKFPVIAVPDATCDVGWKAITQTLRKTAIQGRFVVCVECYPGCFEGNIEAELVNGLKPHSVIRSAECYKSENEIRTLTARDLGDDPVFAFMNNYELSEFLDERKLGEKRADLNTADGLVLVIGTGAALIAEHWDLLVYCDMARWKIQQRQRANEIANLGLENATERASLKYKRAFFVDWRAADRLKKQLLPKIDFVLDTNDRATPKMINGAQLAEGLRIAAHRPFRVVPFFDPGPWGGQWMKEVCDLPRDAENYAWCFDCVPEENSLLLAFGDARVEIPSINLVFARPHELLGEAVHARFGTEFPIRFDFLDTMDGGNLSFQVHPLTEYIQEKFGMNYTQDESYYMLDATEEGCVYLGLKENIDRGQMIDDLHLAQEGEIPFDAEKYVNRFPAKKHDHFLIPAGTPHCSGKNSMVLEISATPYIFTFKMWDWGRLGLDGTPRPIHLEHGLRNVQWDRTTKWVEENLVNHTSEVDRGEGWVEERTGLHEREFIETRRHWFTTPVRHNTNGGVNVLNLCEGREAMVESPTSAFPPFVVHFAETFIVPAAVGEYTIRPHGESEGKRCATIKAFVRSNP